jgi:hypothetical protein
MDLVGLALDQSAEIVEEVVDGGRLLGHSVGQRERSIRGELEHLGQLVPLEKQRVEQLERPRRVALREDKGLSPQCAVVDVLQHGRQHGRVERQYRLCADSVSIDQ